MAGDYGCEPQLPVDSSVFRFTWEGHTWQDKNNWGYQNFKSTDYLIQRYRPFMDTMTDIIRQGLSAAVYTQTTDVEIETNGLMTYDRKIIKIPAADLKQMYAKLYSPSLVMLK